MTWYRVICCLVYSLLADDAWSHQLLAAVSSLFLFRMWACAVYCVSWLRRSDAMSSTHATSTIVRMRIVHCTIHIHSLSHCLHSGYMRSDAMPSPHVTHQWIRAHAQYMLHDVHTLSCYVLHWITSPLIRPTVFYIYIYSFFLEREREREI